MIDLLGKGTFGQVVKCKIVGNEELFALKIIKNKMAYFCQGKNEIQILKTLTQNSSNRIVKMFDYFLYKKHICIVFEILDDSLYDLLRLSNFVGCSLRDIKLFTKQILEGLIISQNLKIIHCDLKPENILFSKNKVEEIKIIDFGSACFENNIIFTYIQSRFYRAPEVILGSSYSMGIDIWSLGCICAELYLGLPIFPGNSQYDQLKRIISIVGYLFN